MRPRVFPAEDAANQVWKRGPANASMRPRVFPAEDGVQAGQRFGDMLSLQ